MHALRAKESPSTLILLRDFGELRGIKADFAHHEIRPRKRPFEVWRSQTIAEEK